MTGWPPLAIMIAKAKDMAIRVKCSGCGKTIVGGEDWAGKRAKCPKCSTVVEFPAPTTFVSPDIEEPSEAWLGGPVPTQPPLTTFDSPLTSAASPPPPIQHPRPSPAVEDKVRCPFCQELIVGTAKKCKHCGEIIDPVLKELRNSSVARANTSGTDKRILPAFLLAFFFGMLGVHRFYVGKTGSGAAILILTFSGWITLIVLIGVFLLLAAAIWVLVDLLFILLGEFTDGGGVKITQWT